MTRFPFPLPRGYEQRDPYEQRGSDQRGGRPMFGVGQQSGGGGLQARLIIALVIALFAILSYYGAPGDKNAITGETERVALAEEKDEMALGLQAAPQMVQQHGGVSQDRAARDHVMMVGARLLRALDEYAAERGGQNPYRFNFTLLADPRTVNAFALPGGQVFITEALYRQLETEGQLAGVLGHEIGHVVARHGNKRMAKEQLFAGLATAAGTAGGDMQSMQMAQAIKQMVSMKYGRDDEFESDSWGVRLQKLAGYDPNSMKGVMEVLERAGGEGPPEMMSTHPKPANRIKYIEEVIHKEFPNGVPAGLEP